MYEGVGKRKEERKKGGIEAGEGRGGGKRVLGGGGGETREEKKRGGGGRAAGKRGGRENKRETIPREGEENHEGAEQRCCGEREGEEGEEGDHEVTAQVVQPPGARVPSLRFRRTAPTGTGLLLRSPCCSTACYHWQVCLCAFFTKTPALPLPRLGILRNHCPCSFFFLVERY